MVYYLIAAIFPLFGWGMNHWINQNYQLTGRQKKRVEWWMVIISILPMFLLFVLRNKVIGTDTSGYVRLFMETIPKYSFNEILQGKTTSNEIGFSLYLKLISLITSNYTIFFLFNGIIIFGALLHFSYKHTNNRFVFFFLYVTLGTYNFALTGLRQALAMSICLLAVELVSKRKLIPFLLCIFLASLFHKSAWIFLIVYPLVYLKKYDWMFFVYAIIAGFFILGFSFFQELFNSFLGYDYNIEETGNGGIFVLLIIIFFVYSFYMLYDNQEEKRRNLISVHLSILTIIFWLLRLISRTAERISFYYICGLYVYFAQTFGYQKDKLASLLKWLLILAALALYVYRSWGASYMFVWGY